MGRPKGSKGNNGVHRGPSKITQEVRTTIKDVILDPNNIAHVQDAMDKLYRMGEYKDFLYTYRAFLEFALPKLSAVKVTPKGGASDFKDELAIWAETED